MNLEQVKVEVVDIVTDGVINRKNMYDMYCYFEHTIGERFYGGKPNHEQVNIILDEVKSPIKIDLSSMSIQPINESKYILTRIEEYTPQNSSVILVKYKDVILGSISVIVDSRSTLFKLPIGYFIGIRKSNELFSAMYINPDRFKDFKLSAYLIPAVMEYSRTKGAKFVGVTPIAKMPKILTKYHGFIRASHNKIENTYEPAAYIMTIEEEDLYFKRC